MCSAVQGELENSFELILKQLELEAKRAIVNVRGALERDIGNLGRNVPQCAAVSRNRPEKDQEASSITETRNNISIGQGAGPSSAPRG